MNTAFVDKLRFIPCPKAHFDKQPKKHEVRFYYFFRENGKRNEISSRAKEQHVSHTREDEKKDGAMSSNAAAKIKGDRIYFAGYCLDEVKKPIDDLCSSWYGFSDKSEKLDGCLNSLRVYWIEAIGGDEYHPHRIHKTIDTIEFIIGEMARMALESPRVKPAKESPEDYTSLLMKTKEYVGNFIFIMSSDMLDIIEYRVRKIMEKRLSYVDRTELYNLVLDYNSLISPIKKGLSYHDHNHMIMDPKDSDRIEKLYQSVKALKRQLEEPSRDALRRVGLRS